MTVPPIEPPVEPAATDFAARVSARPQGLRYLVIGGWNTAFAYCLFAGLQLLLGDRIHYLILLAVATVFAILNAFICYRKWVFQVQGHWFRDLGRFSMVYVGSFLINLAALPLMVEVLGLPVLVAQAVTVVGTVIASFFAHRSFSFRRDRAA